MPWWTCFNCANIRSPQNSSNDVFVLDFAHHSLHDVPADVFQYERTLEELYLSSNRITELPRQLFYCHELKILYLNDNDLAQIPAAISSLVNLNKINLARNSLTRLTDSIIACKSLTYLDLSVNSLEKLPDAITSLIGLEELYLNDTFLEFLPANFGRLTNLRILELRDNNLITLPKSMTRLHHLRRLDIGNNEFTELPDVIGHLVSLTELWCDGNRIRRINCNVAPLKELVHFDASNNLLQYLPTEIGNWQRCQEICLSTNELEELPFSIGMMKSLIALKVDENQLQELPDSICELENLEELMVSHNDLFKLPTTIGLLRRLRFLTADENLLRILPNELCSCASLTILSVRGNKLTKIPVDIGRLTHLRVLNVVNNFLSNLPVTILNLSQLKALWISDNQSQPLMPLQNEFNKETQSYYLTCFLLPQMMNTMPSHTAESTPTNAASTPTAQDSTYDYYSGSTCDESQQNMHMAALENLSLAALSARASSNVTNKRRICFASEPPQEITPIDQTSRLMRSPTPYPKELRMMAKFATKNHAHAHQAAAAAAAQQQQQNFGPNYTQPKNLTNNFDEVDNMNEMANTKLLNIANHAMNNDTNDSGQQQQQQYASQQEHYNNFEQNNGYGTSPANNEYHQRNSNPEQSSVSNAHELIYQNQVNYSGESMMAPGTHPQQQQQQQYQPARQWGSDFDGSSATPNARAHEVDYNIVPHHMPLTINNYCDPLASQLPKSLLPPMSNADLVQYESFNGKLNRMIPSSVDDNSCYSSKRVSQASSTNSTNVEERPLYDLTAQNQYGAPIQSNIYADKPSPKPMNENNLYYQRVQQSSPNFNQTYQSVPLNHEQNYNSIYDDTNAHNEKTNSIDHHQSNDISALQSNETVQMQQQQPPPYHIAKAFTKKSKQDLLIYDIYRSNYQQQHQLKNDQPMESTPAEHMHSLSLNTTTSTSSSPRMLDKNSNTSDSNNGVDSDNNDINSVSEKRSNSQMSNHLKPSGVATILTSPAKPLPNSNTIPSTNTTPTKPWLFGVHKNPTVIQLSVPKVSSDIGFKIVQYLNQGVYISEVDQQSSADGKLQVMDKLLDVDGVDFTKISLADAQTVLSNAGPIVNIMLSRGK